METISVNDPDKDFIENVPKKDPKSKTGPKTEAGKEFASGNLTVHGFYSNKFFPCNRCPRNNQTKVWDKQSKCEEKRFLDKFGIERCSIEHKEFERLLNHFFKEYDHLNIADQPTVERMIMIMIRLGRVESYLADSGLVQATPVFNPKSGETHWLDAQNVLKKDAYYDDRTLRQWLESLRLTKDKDDNKDKSQKLDIAISLVD